MDQQTPNTYYPNGTTVRVREAAHEHAKEAVGEIGTTLQQCVNGEPLDAFAVNIIGVGFFAPFKYAQLEEVFLPRTGAFSKAQVLELVNDLDDVTINKADPAKLTPERMQQFVDDWHDQFTNTEGWCTVDSIGDAQHALVVELANEIQLTVVEHL